MSLFTYLARIALPVKEANAFPSDGVTYHHGV